MTIYLLAGTMLLAFAGFICYRVLIPHKPVTWDRPSSQEMNIALYQQYAAELGRQYPSDSEHEKDQLLVEAQRQLLLDEERPDEPAIVSKRGAVLLAGIAVVLMILAVVLYARLGATADLQIRALLEEEGPGAGAALRTALANRLEQKDDNFYYWLMLARLDLAEQRTEDAIAAYRNALRLSPQDATVIAELAQSLFIQANHQLTGEGVQLVLEALSLDPNNTTALELAGIAAFAKGDYQTAITSWQRALGLLDGGSPNARALQAGMSRARELQAIKGSGSNTGSDAASHSGSSGGDSDEKNVPLLTLSIKLDESLAQLASPNPTSTVYVYARQWQGPPMPLVAQRYTVADLPIELGFTDAMSLSPARQLSSVGKIEVIVRISSGGSLKASSGDLEGRLGPISPSEKTDYAVTIDRQLP